MIKSIHINDRDVFYENEHLNQIVNLSLNNIDNHLFFDILDLISEIPIKYIDLKINLFKNKHGNEELYDTIRNILISIYSDINIDNLRGSFLELLIFKFLNKKYDDENNYISDLNCKIRIFNYISVKTVDIFALCEKKGFICECKINQKYFDSNDLKNLNEIYNTSQKVLEPYIITLAPKKIIEDKLYEITLNDQSNVLVHWRDITIISIDEINSFFS